MVYVLVRDVVLILNQKAFASLPNVDTLEVVVDLNIAWSSP